jgi:AraC-like DNA-binding protein
MRRHGAHKHNRRLRRRRKNFSDSRLELQSANDAVTGCAVLAEHYPVPTCPNIALREGEDDFTSSCAGRHSSLGELAVGVGLSEKRLNAGFRLLFGETVFEVLRNERLAHAQIALRSEAASLKEIAFRVGYNHVTNFITAFTARYGAPPRQYADSDFLTAEPSSLRA